MVLHGGIYIIALFPHILDQKLMLSGSSSLLSLHVGDQVDDPAGVAELVVVPGHHL